MGPHVLSVTILSGVTRSFPPRPRHLSTLWGQAKRFLPALAVARIADFAVVVPQLVHQQAELIQSAEIKLAESFVQGDEVDADSRLSLVLQLEKLCQDGIECLAPCRSSLLVAIREQELTRYPFRLAHICCPYYRCR